MKIRDYVQNSSNQNLSKQNEMIKSEEIFEYICDCIGVIDLHMKINYLNISYKCSKCSKKLELKSNA